jgi:hypothetical protein
MIWYSGPHIGVTSDIKLFRDNCPWLEPGERLLGDKAYVGEPEYLIPPLKKKKGAPKLTGRAHHFNNVHAWYRATIEHCFAFIKRYVAVDGYERYYVCVSIIIDSDVIMFDIVIYRRYRILNGVYRGHVTSHPHHLSDCLKIIMHTSYMYTKDNPQRRHQDMDVSLVEADVSKYRCRTDATDVVRERQASASA